MRGAEKHCRVTVVAELPEASIADLLLYGLTLELDDDDPAFGVLLGVRREVGLVACLAECSRPGTEFEFGEVVSVLESIGRRLDVAIELLTRSHRVSIPNERLEQAPGVALEGASVS
jgi:hypothetical protein